jgi:hypothetical protein
MPDRLDPVGTPRPFLRGGVGVGKSALFQRKCRNERILQLRNECGLLQKAVWTFAKKVWTFEEKVWSFHFLRKLYTELFGALQINMYICTTFLFHFKP